MGYPTANLDRRYFARHPVPEGVWACKVRVRKSIKSVKSIKSRKWLKGVAVVGVKAKVEVHVLDFDKNINGWYCEAELVRKIRPLRAYTSPAVLIAQIERDIRIARHILRSTPCV